jgi:phosphoglycolate phosphatase-like HAD superfamily hydrolase
MLILFDIDGTLLLTQGAGIRAMEDAGRELFGEHFTIDGVEFSGRLDVLIWNDLAALNRVPDHHTHHDRFREAYGRHLDARLKRDRAARLLPGVKSLVHRLRDDHRFTLGLLTGNYPETGRLKITSAGLDPAIFTIAAWGCDGPSRRALTPIAIELHGRACGRRMNPEQVVVIGDTPHDVDCAKAHGCRSIAVATGMFNRPALTQAGADLVLDSLEDSESIVRWIMTAPAAVSNSA